MEHALRTARQSMAMDRHEKGIARDPNRIDLPLPEWKGDYGGDPDHLPKVVHRLLQGRILTAEEKAELLWRFFELDQRARARERVTSRALAILVVVLGIAVVALYHKAWIATQIMAWLSPPASPTI